MELHYQSDPLWTTLLQDWAAQRSDVASIWIFGSRVTGHRRTKPDQRLIPDLDIAIEATDASEPDLPVFDAVREISELFKPVHADIQSFRPNSGDEVAQWVAKTGIQVWPSKRESPPSEENGPR